MIHLASLLYKKRTFLSGLIALSFILISITDFNYYTILPTIRNIPLSLTLLIIGICLRLIAFNYIGADVASPEPTVRQLIACGPYRIIRHPLYTAAMLIYASFMLKIGSTLLTFMLLLLSCLYYYFLAVYEEQFLKNRYGDYAEYMKIVPRFIPNGRLYPKRFRCETLVSKYGIIGYLRNLMRYELAPIFALITWLLIR